MEIKDPIIEKVVNKIIERSEVGIKKYNTTLHDNNRDNFLNHLQMELMDAVNYIEKLQSQNDFLDLQNEVIQWAEDKGILSSGTIIGQLSKVVEEIGELVKCIGYEPEINQQNELGDVLVTLIILAKMKNFNILNCLKLAVGKNNKRTGQMIGGIFVKNE